jgi:A/G-specific adenine glycosylase
MIRRSLLRWFDANQRSLPWRLDRDPYRIWVSEIMLQQTQVATVVPFFERFLAAFPTLADLAVADEQQVLRLWEGLGYYRRARQMHRAARIIVGEHGGVFPRDPLAAGRLPGIGRYTVGAILSQAFDARLPILEANSRRVLCRLFARRADPRSPEEQRWLWEAAQALLPQRRSGDFNQALMELGALVCASGIPACERCPLERVCRARQLGIEEQIPLRAKRPEPKTIAEAAVVLVKKGKYLLVQRPARGRWENMWEFPHGPIQPGETHDGAAARILFELTNLEGTIGNELLAIKHSVTHHQITLVCFEALYSKGRFASEFYQKGEWVDATRLAEAPVSSPQRRLARFLAQAGRQRSLF